MQIPILSGITSDGASDFRTKYPRNMVPVPKAQGISEGYLRPAEGITLFGTGPGVDRGCIVWRGVLYRVQGTSLVRVAADGAVTVLGDVGGSGQVTMDYSFDVLSISSGGRLFYWDGETLTRVEDTDVGTVKDHLWVAGYFMVTDGETVAVTELTDRTAVNPLKYGSSESDPDPVVALMKLRNEVYLINRHTIEAFENIGGQFFPFQRIPGAQVQRGAIGTHACTEFLGSIAFVGSGRNEGRSEPPSVYLMTAGNAVPIATREIDQALMAYPETQLAEIVVEARVSKAHQHLLIHLPDQTLVYDAAASREVQQPVWFTLASSVVGDGQYLARNFAWCYDQWLAGDPTSGRIGRMVDDAGSHYGALVGWEFGTLAVYNAGKGAIWHEMELVALPGRAALGDEPVIWTSYSLDGQQWSQEKPISAGKRGETLKRLSWRKQGKTNNFRMQKFRGTSDARASFARLEVTLEPLNG